MSCFHILVDCRAKATDFRKQLKPYLEFQEHVKSRMWNDVNIYYLLKVPHGMNCRNCQASVEPSPEQDTIVVVSVRPLGRFFSSIFCCILYKFIDVQLWSSWQPILAKHHPPQLIVWFSASYPAVYRLPWLVPLNNLVLALLFCRRCINF